MYDRSVHCTQRKITQRWDKFLKENRIAGIDSDVYPDSLLNMLQPLVQDGTITQQHSDDLIDLMRTLTAENNIVLEAVGGPEKDPRMYSPQATWEINSVVDSLGLSTENRAALDAVLNQWAKLNSVRFHPDPAPEALPTSALPPIAPPIGTDDEVPPEGPEITPTAGPDAEVPAGPDDEGAGEDTEEKEELSTLGKVELGIEAALNTVSAAGVIPAFEATLIPSAATLGSLVFNLARGKMSAAMLDVVALAPVVGKASKLGKLGPIGAKIAAKVGPASFKGGRLLIKTFGSAKNARAAITTMKSAKAAKDLAKAGSATKELIENVPEEWVTEAIYRKDENGEYWIDTVLDGVSMLSSLPGIPDGIGSAADELKQSVDSLRKAIPPPKESEPDSRDVPEPGMDPSEFPPLPPEATSKAFGSQRYGGLAEDVERLQTLAGIKKRIL